MSITWERDFGIGPLLHEELIFLIEDEKRECPMQRTLSLVVQEMAFSLTRLAPRLVILIHQYALLLEKGFLDGIKEMALGFGREELMLLLL